MQELPSGTGAEVGITVTSPEAPLTDTVTGPEGFVATVAATLGL